MHRSCKVLVQTSIVALWTHGAIANENQCPDLSGIYYFLGKSIEPTTGELASELRFDEKALAMTLRTVVAPHTVVLSQKVNSGFLSADVIGSGFDHRFDLMSAKLPLTASLVCGVGGWKREVVKIGSGGGGRSSETKQQVLLRLSPEGLVAEGTKSISTGTFQRKTIASEWRIVFERRPETK